MTFLLSLVLACGSQAEPSSPSTEAPSEARFAMADEMPGFHDAGAWTGEGPAPVYVTLSLNVNDFLRPEREAQAVARVLDDTRKAGAGKLEISMTGHVLEAIQRVDPAVLDRIKSEQHTILEHHRLLEWRGLVSTERELYWTDPESLQLDRTRSGPFVLSQQVFGVSPRNHGELLGELMRASWEEGEETRRLEAAGAHLLETGRGVCHPSRLVASALEPDGEDGHRAVEAHLRVSLLAERITRGDTLRDDELEERYVDLVRMAQTVKTLGFDLGAVAGLDAFTDHARLPDYTPLFDNIQPSEAERAAFRSRVEADAAGVKSEMTAVLTALTERMAALPDLATEITAKIAQLPTDRIHIARLAWHATDDYTVGSWAQNINQKRRFEPVSTRPADEQRAIAAAMTAAVKALVSPERVQLISLGNDTQWAPENAAAPAYDRLGVSLTALPEGLSVAAIEEAASEAGVVSVQQAAPRRGKAGKAGKAGKMGKARGGKRGRGR